ncbi:MAG TPA: hypothetical protein PLU35_05700 [Phycisphaerales bacterium]|nr:hypothetical protein [Phycisphaerales bacterium]
MSITQIQASGDPLERRMFADATFSEWFGAYVTVWANHVLTRRQADGLVVPEWREFAQRNYTAIVRCWNAWTIQQQVKAAVADGAQVDRQLGLHGLLAGFFAMTRAAQENLHHAFVNKAKQKPDDFAYVDRLGTGYPNLGWVRHPRNDLLHNRTLPMRVNPSGVVEVDRSLLPKNGTSVPWHAGIGDWFALGTLVDDVWGVFPHQMNTLWAELDSRLATARPSTSPSCGTGAGTPGGLGTSSGVPSSGVKF